MFTKDNLEFIIDIIYKSLVFTKIYFKYKLLIFFN